MLCSIHHFSPWLKTTQTSRFNRIIQKNGNKKSSQTALLSVFDNFGATDRT
jgi:hypothetical protein